MMNLARQEGKLHVVPHFPMLKENPARKGFIEHAQFEKLFAQLPPKLQPFVMFLFYCGVRSGEAKKIAWDQVNLDTRQIRLEGEQTKNSEPRILPLPEVLVTLLTQQANRTGLVFPVGSFRKAWMSACVKAGLGQWGDEDRKFETYSGLLVHDLRRSAVRNLRKAGIPESVIMKISGHRTREVFERYNIVDTTDVHHAMNRLEASTKVIDVTAQSQLTGATK
jgi:integrase